MSRKIITDDIDTILDSIDIKKIEQYIRRRKMDKINGKYVTNQTTLNTYNNTNTPTHNLGDDIWHNY